MTREELRKKTMKGAKAIEYLKLLDIQISTLSTAKDSSIKIEYAYNQLVETRKKYLEIYDLAQ